MKLVDRRARATWRAFQQRARLALMDAPASVRQSLLTELEAHVAEALAREDGETSEFESIQRVLARIGDPVQFVRPLLDDAAQTSAARRQRRWPLAPLTAALLAFVSAIAFIAWGSTALSCPDGAGLFQLGPDELQVRLLCRTQPGTPIGAPWVAITSIVTGVLLAAWGWRCVRRVRSALLMRRSQ